MVAYAIEKETKPAAGYICPKCFQHLKNYEYALLSDIRDRYDRVTRTYYGFHIECKIGFEVVQFKQDGLWKIHKFRLYAEVQEYGKSCPDNWIIVAKLPEPAPVITGQGGEYDKPFEPETIDLMETVLMALKATAKTVESLLKLIKLK